MSNGTEWTIGEIKALARLRRQGASGVDIARVLGRTLKAVRHQCAKRGITKKPPPAPSNRLSANGPPIAERTRWIRPYEDARLTALMAGRRFEDRELPPCR